MYKWIDYYAMKKYEDKVMPKLAECLTKKGHQCIDNNNDLDEKCFYIVFFKCLYEAEGAYRSI